MEAKAHLALSQILRTQDPVAAFEHLEKARETEQKMFSETSAKQLQAVALKRETWDLQRDLQEEKRVREETARLLAELETQKKIAEEASRQKSAILSIAAHDLGNSLSSILLGLEAVAANWDNPQRREHLGEELDDLSLSAKGLRQLLRRLLDFAAFESGEISSYPVALNLREAISTHLHQWQLIANEKRQVIHFDCRYPEVMTRVDPFRFEQILGNLLSNALKYSPARSQVDVKVAPVEHAWCIEVHDTGPGLSEQDQLKLFRAFQTLTPRPTGKESSTGLGLHITKAITENEGGTVGYDPREGGGSVFWLQLPVLTGGDH